MDQPIQNILTALLQTSVFVNKKEYKTEIDSIKTMPDKTAKIAPLVTKIQTAADIQTRDTSGDKQYVSDLKMNAGKVAIVVCKKVQVAANESGDKDLIKMVNKPITHYSSAPNGQVITRTAQLAKVLLDNLNTVFKGLITNDDIDNVTKAGQEYDSNRTLPSDNKRDKQVNGTNVLAKCKKEGTQLLKDIRTLGEGFLPEGSTILNGLLEASDIPEFGKRHTNVHVLVTREDGTLIGKGITAQDLSPTAQASKKKAIYNSNDKSIVPIDEHLPGTSPFLFAAPGCQSKQQDLTFEKGKTINTTIVLKAI